MFVSAVGVSGAWNGISNLIDEINYSKMQKLAQEVSWDDIDGGAELDELLGKIDSVKYSPINPGPLDEKVANSFNSAVYTEKVLLKDTIMYRVSGGNSTKVGSYMSRTPQYGGLQSQLDLALNPAWGNTAENVTKIVVPKGTIIYEGKAAPQNIYDSLNNVVGKLIGGGNQVYIPIVDERWFQ